MIDLLPNSDQQALVDAVAGLLQREVRFRQESAPGLPEFNRALWRRLIELGCFGIGITVELGGIGLSAVEAVLVHRELGRHLVPGPVIPTFLAVHLATAQGALTIAQSILDGTSVVGLAERHQEANGWILWDQGAADLILAVDHVSGDATLVENLDQSIVRRAPSIDPGLQIGQFVGSLPAPLVGPTSANSLLTLASLLIAAQLVGIAEATRDASVGYCTSRVQFGKKIGAFQAVKHRCADMALRSEAMWAQTALASLLHAAGSEESSFQIMSARYVASDGAIRNARDNIQNHGGIGFTAEHPAHLHLKRAHILDSMLGSSRQCLEFLSKQGPGPTARLPHSRHSTGSGFEGVVWATPSPSPQSAVTSSSDSAP